MSLSSSLLISTGGLLAQSAAITGISNNLANTSTTAFKETGTSFSDLITSDSSTSSSGFGGVSASVKYNNDDQGTLSATSSTTDLAINGRGYFAVCTASDTTGTLVFSTDTFYTRCGDFSLNKDGYLENSEGFYLMGWSVDQTTNIPIRTLVPVQISPDETNAAIASTVLSYSANIPAGYTGTTSSSSTSVYDSLGNKHTVSYSWAPTAVTNRWTLTATATDGHYTAGPPEVFAPVVGTATVTFDSSGKMGAITAPTGCTVTGNTISLDVGYKGATTQRLSCDLSGVTQYAGTAVDVASFTANGVATGSYKSTGVDTSGNINVTYSNGQNVTYYQVPVATFVAPDSLAMISGNAYAATIAAGTPTLSTAGTYGAGIISGNRLEDSTVDIAGQFTNMVQSQQIYSANAKIITTASAMMKTLIDLQ